jgi:hypothetical protein
MQESILDLKISTSTNLGSKISPSSPRSSRSSAFYALSPLNVSSSISLKEPESLTSSPLGSSASRRGGSVIQRWIQDESSQNLPQPPPIGDEDTSAESDLFGHGLPFKPYEL